MGFIKSIQRSVKGQYTDQFREIIKWERDNQNVLIKKVTTENGVITDKSRLYVQPGQCAIFVDNGAVKDVITEPGMYFMDTSAPSLFQTNIFKGLGTTILESIKRIAYQGDEINQQLVYFISVQENLNIAFNTNKPILYKDPEWGPMEIGIQGTYAFQITNPIELIENVAANNDEFTIDRLASTLTPFVISEISTELSNLNVSFDAISKKQSELGKNSIKNISSKLKSLGLEITKVVVTSIDVPEEVKKSMRNRTSIKMKASSVSDKEADIYQKLNTAEAIKDLANNQNNSGSTLMGMNLGNAFGGILTDNDKDKKN